MSTGITEETVKEYIKKIDYYKVGEKTTVGVATLTSGFEVAEHSHVQDPKAYDQEIGEALCRERIYLRVWEFVAFARAQEAAKSAEPEPVAEVKEEPVVQVKEEPVVQVKEESAPPKETAKKTAPVSDDLLEFSGVSSNG